LYVLVQGPVCWTKHSAHWINHKKPNAVSEVVSEVDNAAKEAVVHQREVLIAVNFVLSLVPRPFTTAMIAREMPAAIIHILWLSRRIRPQEMRELFSSSDLAAKPLKQS
jgi:hypothetical protein